MRLIARQARTGSCADRGLVGEHHRVGAVEHRVRDVGDLGARRARRGHHRLQHLRRGDRGPARADRRLHDALLLDRHALERDLERQVAARDHHRVRAREDRLEVLERELGLDLRDQRRRPAETLERRAARSRCPPACARTRRRPGPRRARSPSSRSRRSFGARIGRADRPPGAFTPLPLVIVPPTTTRQWISLPSTSRTSSSTAPSPSRIGPPGRASWARYSSGTGSVCTSPFDWPQASVTLRAGLERERGRLDLAEPDLRPRQVLQNGDGLPRRERRRAHARHGLAVLRVGAVREVDPRHVHAGLDQAEQGFRRAAGRPDRADDVYGAGAHLFLDTARHALCFIAERAGPGRGC